MYTEKKEDTTTIDPPKTPTDFLFPGAITVKKEYATTWRINYSKVYGIFFICKSRQGDWSYDQDFDWETDALNYFMMNLSIFEQINHTFKAPNATDNVTLAYSLNRFIVFVFDKIDMNKLEFNLKDLEKNE